MSTFEVFAQDAHTGKTVLTASVKADGYTVLGSGVQFFVNKPSEDIREFTDTYVFLGTSWSVRKVAAV